MRRLQGMLDAVAGLELGLTAVFGKSSVARFIHSSLGHEVPAWAVTSAISPETACWALYYRCHAWLLGLGCSTDSIVQEIAGRGPLGGRGGSMHLLLHPNVIDCNSVVGAQLPIAVGAALQARLCGGRVVCVLGDGATNTGVFYEAVNIAGVHAVPLLFVVEDNGLAIGTAYRETCRAEVPKKFHLFGVPCRSVDASQPGEVLTAAKAAAAELSIGPRALHVRLRRNGPHALAMGQAPAPEQFSAGARKEAKRLASQFRDTGSRLERGRR